ncbi:hypothetical protein [Wenjunlia tyrosinilytica]|uniref:Uncharacterized protein n=1 Tax=Wenjunlia tyrosinilytica TaxID=1544741 RepID=A0A917ZGF0_9ACTN|nr:hypothetical protein [Wenjunlia tyrosinilytica]GGO82653.1 hypothetical protein GCM10012280_09760 [Wenjunlia tyrosinilytica]
MSTPTPARKPAQSGGQRQPTPAGKQDAGGGRKRAPSKQAASKRTTPAPAARSAQRRTAGHDGHDITVHIPVDRMAHKAADAAMLPVAVAGRVLPAKGGLPVYIGLGALGAAGVIEWPVALGIGAGYAILRRTGLMPSSGAQTQRGDSAAKAA